jgi:methyl-accepting chemotaxis protein
MRASLADLEIADRSGIMRQLAESVESGTAAAGHTTAFLLPQQILVPWGEKVNVLRLAIVNAVVERVTDRHKRREREFDVVITGFGLVVIAILEAIFLLRRRVVSPLAQLGVAITRIAAGDRSVPMTMQSDTSEIAEMVTAVETLRQAALVADFTAMRQRMAARQRFLLLREALGIAQTVWEPSRALELGVARLSKGIDATVALVATATSDPPATLGFAADAVRTGLAEMRGSAAELDATFAAASSAQTGDRSEAEFVAHVMAVRAQVDRRDATVRSFIQPSLLALRDANGTTGTAGLRDLVNDQFERIEATVATLASMRDAVTRATTIIRELPLEEAPLAA